MKTQTTEPAKNRVASESEPVGLGGLGGMLLIAAVLVLADARGWLTKRVRALRKTP